MGMGIEGLVHAVGQAGWYPTVPTALSRHMTAVYLSASERPRTRALGLRSTIRLVFLAPAWLGQGFVHLRDRISCGDLRSFGAQMLLKLLWRNVAGSGFGGRIDVEREHT